MMTYDPGKLIQLNMLDLGRDLALKDSQFHLWLMFTSDFYKVILDEPIDEEVLCLVPYGFINFLEDEIDYNIVLDMEIQGLRLEEYFPDDSYKFCFCMNRDDGIVWGLQQDPWKIMFAGLGDEVKVLLDVFE